jgi:hypothetical protein
MTTAGYAVSARRSDDVFDHIGTLAALARTHTATGQEFDLVTITVATGYRHAYLTGGHFLAATDDGAIIRHA